MQSNFQEKFSYTMTVRDILDEGSAMVWDGSCRRIGGGGSCFRQFASVLVARDALMTWNPDEYGWAFPFC